MMKEIGKKVEFTGCNEEQKNMGNCDNPEGKLHIGSEREFFAVYLKISKKHPPFCYPASKQPF